jgi:hypothetical protein
MPAEAVTAEVEFVNPAMDDWNFDAAQIASTPHPFRLRFSGWEWRARLQRAGFHINAARRR